MRIGKHSQDRVRAIAAWLASLEPGQTAMPELVDELRELLELDTVAAFGFRPAAEGVELDWFEIAGRVAPRRGRYYTEKLVRGSPRLGLYDALCPEPTQRDRIVCVDVQRAVGDERLTAYAPTFRQLGIDAQAWDDAAGFMDWADHSVYRPMGFGRFHLRTLICHGDTLIGWVGGCLDERPSERQLALLRALVPALKNRLFLEQSVREAALCSASLDVVLDELGTPSFLVDRAGVVRRANVQGKHVLTTDRALRDRLRQAVTGRQQDRFFVVTRVQAPGMPDLFLVRQRRGAVPNARVAVAAARFGFTARQAQVVALVARGLTNKSIAANLAISEKTVENHLGAVFAKTEVTCRSELVALLLQVET